MTTLIESQIQLSFISIWQLFSISKKQLIESKPARESACIKQILCLHFEGKTSLWHMAKLLGYNSHAMVKHNIRTAKDRIQTKDISFLNYYYRLKPHLP